MLAPRKFPHLLLHRHHCLSLFRAPSPNNLTFEPISSPGYTTTQHCHQNYREQTSRFAKGSCRFFFTTNQDVPSLVFSGIQPTGKLHIGNYLGALRYWKKIQDSQVLTGNRKEEHHSHDIEKNVFQKCIFSIVDLHGITILPESPKQFSQSCFEMQKTFLACGLDPQKSTLYLQSHLSAHTELTWILSCFTPVNWLNKMVQFKEKKEKLSESSTSTGLYIYPILMASDVLLYAVHVPVGNDQIQHLELTNDIASCFNSKVGHSFFNKVQVLLSKSQRVMSLRDARKKMSKSDPVDVSRINMTDDTDEINKKIMRAKTDGISGITLDPEARPEIRNLLEIYAGFAPGNMTAADVAKQFENEKTATFKSALVELLVSEITPIAEEMKRLDKDPEYVNQVFLKGAQEANEIASETLKYVKEMIGYLPHC